MGKTIIQRENILFWFWCQHHISRRLWQGHIYHRSTFNNSPWASGNSGDHMLDLWERNVVLFLCCRMWPVFFSVFTVSWWGKWFQLIKSLVSRKASSVPGLFSDSPCFNNRWRTWFIIVLLKAARSSLKTAGMYLSALTFSPRYPSCLFHTL